MCECVGGGGGGGEEGVSLGGLAETVLKPAVFTWNSPTALYAHLTRLRKNAEIVNKPAAIALKILMSMG